MTTTTKASTDKPADTTTSARSVDSTAGDDSQGGGVEAAHSQAAQNRLTDRERVAAETSRLGAPDPYPPYDLMSLGELRAVAAELEVTIPPDVEKSLLITELRAFRSGTLSVARRRSA